MESRLSAGSVKMLPKSHFKAFNDIKSEHFSNALTESSRYFIISCIRPPVAQ